MPIILTHANADFDAVAALLAAHKLNPDATPALPDRLNRNVEEFVTLYQNGLPFVQYNDLPAKAVDSVILVDTQRIPQGQRGVIPETPLHIIDHHKPKIELRPGQTMHTELVGAVTTLLVEQIQQQGVRLNSLEATLLALGIYEDTGSLTYGTTTPRDIRAAAWLLEHQAVLDTVRRFLAPPLNEQQQMLYDALLSAAENRTIQGYTVIVSGTKVEHYISEISSVAHRLRDTLDPAALIIAVQMPTSLQLVCRSTGESLDVGEIARFFGGGGHERAAAATVHDRTLDETIQALWEQIQQRIRPVTRVADLMSFGVQTVDADKRVSEVIHQIRRIGHEGYPVIENGRIIGLLTRREADRAAEHGLGNLLVRDIMTGGSVTLLPEDSVSTLEQRMVESGWGQIPVVNETGALIGIITRTDLIKHWARTHPARPIAHPTISASQIEAVLGEAVAALIHLIARHAQQQNITLYMVGGVVRDVLLFRRNLDIDFVVEGNAIDLAEALCARFGGHVSSYRPFGTAKWLIDEQTAQALGLDLHDLPNHIDFASSRNEFYEHPTALPTVYNSSIKLDLQRRDFTINTLAIQLSPESSLWRILDFYGGMNDLQSKLIRVLHSLSFVDDPTRILRAVRFEQRLGFKIEPRTAELIETALPMLRRITGQRLKNELSLLLNEQLPEQGLLNLQRRGVLQAIHPAFQISDRLPRDFAAARNADPPWPAGSIDLIQLYWHIITCRIPTDQLAPLLERLRLGQTLAESMLHAAHLVQELEHFTLPDIRPSQVVRRLTGIEDMALLAAWLLIEEPLAKERIQRYMLEWRYIHARSNGHTLRVRGLKPGPAYKVILERLRNARLDGEIQTDDEEEALLQTLINEEFFADGGT